MKQILIILLLLLAVTKISFAQESGLGVGIILGEPTGLSGKYWLDESTAADFGIATGLFGENAGFSLHADYLYHNKNLVQLEYKLPVYYGFGVRMRFPTKSQLNLGVRGVVGIMLFIKQYPMDVFFEIAPSFRLLPTTGLNLDLAIGTRYYFNK
ncbi:MAG: hypothetical protein KKF62_14905 [Bacteroidetes bacterium]|nr:hypothetical protein [Bacteroidota bacterium]MBU1113984.1 hypothetical protein [Bacteroidota bacterium]MBU1800262.1 hypothetical protein [Bacteroidota bacterium]